MTAPVQSLVDLYWSYKVSTKYVLEWLYLNSDGESSSVSRSYFKTTKDILSAAKRAKQKQVEVPSSVISNLADAIKKRGEVLKIYTAQARSSPSVSREDDTAKHQAFIDRLERVLRILLPLSAGKISDPAKPSYASKVAAGHSSNRFAGLEEQTDPLMPDESLEALASVENDFEQPSPSSETSSIESIILEDDDLGEWIEMSFLLYEMDTILQQINSYWADVARRQMSLPLAAWLSSAALAAVGRICKSWSNRLPDARVLMEKWIQHKEKGVKIRFTEIPDLTCQFGGRIADEFALHRIYMIVHHMRTEDDYRKIVPDAGRRQDPLSRIRILENEETSNCNSNQMDLDDPPIDSMQESMRQLLRDGRAIAAIEVSDEDQYVSEPLLPLMRRVTNDTSQPISIQLVFGMELLISSYKAFLWTDSRPNKRNCRIEALNFARAVQKELLETAKCIDAIEDHDKGPLAVYRELLSSQADRLSLFIKEVRFDLYYQAPWIAGSHILEIFNASSGFGVQLCSKFGYVCAVLHLYNALRRLEPAIHEITLLDRLCLIFKESVFLGVLPTENFSSHFKRAMNQRPTRQEDSSNLRYFSASSGWEPTKREIRGSDISIFYQLYNECFQTTRAFWGRIYTHQATQTPTQSAIDKFMAELSVRPFNVSLERIRNAAQAEFEQEPAPACLNFFVIFRFCVQVLKDIGDAVERSDSIVSRGCGVGLGYGYVDTILENIVEHGRDDFKRKMMPYWRHLNMVRGVFAKFEKEHCLLESQWKFT